MNLREENTLSSYSKIIQEFSIREKESEFFFFFKILVRSRHRQLWQVSLQMLKLEDKILRLMREYFFFLVFSYIFG